ncbi:Translation initiation factor eIF-2B subunit alpha [Stylophora pistillata]|uniref:Translation initiation factor eIF2B subunit alpha n=1 Tax=Stylophora pistillata TaxID=50429 RepID=A0A2B4RKG4_STYPI|nr:Translation initiation factor eIF-2B subunit alpha [Stylophora pistillata]
MDNEEAVAFFKKCMVDDPGMSTAVAAIQTLLEFMNQNSGQLYLKRAASARKRIAKLCDAFIKDGAYSGSSSSEDGQPVVDYTPPSYITLLFTDLGVLTPSAVSDELIKLYL